MGQGDTGIERVSADDGVRVERSVERKESGLTAEYEIRSLAGSPLRFRVREPLDPDADLDEVGFHPEQEPEEWSIEDRAVVFEGIASPDDPFRTVLGAVVDTGEFLVADPEVERVVRESDETAEPDAEGGGVLAGVRARLFGGGGDADDGTQEAVGAVTVDRAAEVDAEAEADGGDAAGGGVLADVETDLTLEAESEPESEPGPEDGGEREHREEAESERGETTNRPDADNDPDAEASGAPVAREAESGTEAVESDPDGEPADGRGAAASADGTETAGGSGRARTDRDATSTGTRPSAAAVVAAVREDETLREELREALDVEDGSDDPRESADVRLRHVQSRVDDLAAYTDALEEAIDEHGRPAEVLADLRAETEELGATVAELREETETVREEVATVRGQQESARERVEELADATADLRTELEESRDRQQSRIDRLEGDVDGVAADVRATRDDLETELADLRSEVADLREMRETLSTAFAAGPGDGADDGTEESGDGERAGVKAEGGATGSKPEPESSERESEGDAETEAAPETESEPGEAEEPRAGDEREQAAVAGTESGGDGQQ
jgi:archaellum component FlaC